MIRRILLAAAALSLLSGIAAQPAAADSAGYRWRGTTVCVENWAKGSRYDAVSAVVHHANTYTNLSIWHRGPHGCAGFAQRIGVGQVYSSAVKLGWAVIPHTACTLPSSKAFQCIVSPVTIKLNVRYSLNYWGWRDVVAHELGHALGLEHHSFICDSAMWISAPSGCNPGALSWYDRVGTAAHPGINRIYDW